MIGQWTRSKTIVAASALTLGLGALVTLTVPEAPIAPAVPLRDVTIAPVVPDARPSTMTSRTGERAPIRERD